MGEKPKMKGFKLSDITGPFAISDSYLLIDEDNNIHRFI